MTTATARKKTARKTSRTAHVLTRFSSGVLLVEIEERTPKTCKLAHYYVEAIPADFGRAVRFEKFTCQGGEVYAVNIGDKNTSASCECLGHLRHGNRTVCRHVALAKALIAAGKIV